jgi:hypothetical protein
MLPQYAKDDLIIPDVVDLLSIVCWLIAAWY